MKKTKILLPILGIGATAGVAVPMVACSGPTEPTAGETFVVNNAVATSATEASLTIQFLDWESDPGFYDLEPVWDGCWVKRGGVTTNWLGAISTWVDITTGLKTSGTVTTTKGWNGEVSLEPGDAATAQLEFRYKISSDSDWISSKTNVFTITRS